ncbi:hypothetical protein FRB99_007059 [Tulasnella sp. 403]|nr:hypothetical protein FRB99_007059 [Tulasnella sp. 403]
MPPTRTSTTSPEPTTKDVPERSRNAKAQARHREKRKAYIEHVRYHSHSSRNLSFLRRLRHSLTPTYTDFILDQLEKSVATLKSQLQAMGISGTPSANPANSDALAAQNDARLRILVDENERLKNEIQALRARIQSMSSPASAGLTPPATDLIGTVPIPLDATDSTRRRSAELDLLHTSSVLSATLPSADERKSYLASAFFPSDFFASSPFANSKNGLLQSAPSLSIPPLIQSPPVNQAFSYPSHSPPPAYDSPFTLQLFDPSIDPFSSIQESDPSRSESSVPLSLSLQIPPQRHSLDSLPSSSTGLQISGVPPYLQQPSRPGSASPAPTSRIGKSPLHSLPSPLPSSTSSSSVSTPSLLASPFTPNAADSWHQHAASGAYLQQQLPHASSQGYSGPVSAGRELPLPAGFGLALGSAANHQMLSAVRGSANAWSPDSFSIQPPIPAVHSACNSFPQLATAYLASLSHSNPLPHPLSAHLPSLAAQPAVSPVQQAFIPQASPSRAASHTSLMGERSTASSSSSPRSLPVSPQATPATTDAASPAMTLNPNMNVAFKNMEVADSLAVDPYGFPTTGGLDWWDTSASNTERL